MEEKIGAFSLDVAREVREMLALCHDTPLPTGAARFIRAENLARIFRYVADEFRRMRKARIHICLDPPLRIKIAEMASDRYTMVDPGANSALACWLVDLFVAQYDETKLTDEICDPDYSWFEYGGRPKHGPKVNQRKRREVRIKMHENPYLASRGDDYEEFVRRCV